MFPRIPAPPPDWPTALHALGIGSVRWYLIVIATPLLLAASRRMPWSKFSRGRGFAVWVGALVLAVAVGGILEFFAVYWGAPTRPPFAHAAAAALPAQLAAWVAVFSGTALFETRRHAAAVREESSKLRVLIAEQRLSALTRQLEPHFLFNTLQSISTLIHRDALAADHMLAKLGDLLRDLLRHRNSAMICLRDELQYAQTYLDLARLRFGNRLSAQISTEAALGDAAVPLFLLQPIIENSITHSVSAEDRPAAISIRAMRRGDRLTLEVTDDGTGYNADSVRRGGTGLSNVRERLEAAFGSDQHLAITSRSAPDRGTVVYIEVPFRPLSSDT